MTELMKINSLQSENNWVIIHDSDEAVSLLALGDHTFDEENATSVRKNLGAIGRVLLLERLRNALNSMSSFDEKIPYGGRTYRVTVKPILSPDKTMAVGAYGIFTSIGATRPPEPVIGTWQWRVSRKDGTNVGPNASMWDRVLLEEIYRITEDVHTSSRGPAGDWLNKLVAPKDRATIKFMIDSGIDINNRKRHLLTYEAVRGYGSANPEQMQISNSARAYPDPEYPEAVMLRGFSRIVPSPTNIQLPGLMPVPEGMVLQAAFSLLNNSVFAEIDMAQKITFATSPSWADHGLQPGFEMNITSLTHPEDIGQAETYLEESRQKPEKRTPLTVRLKTVHRGYRTFSLTATPIDTERPARYILAHLAPEN